MTFVEYGINFLGTFTIICFYIFWVFGVGIYKVQKPGPCIQLESYPDLRLYSNPIYLHTPEYDKSSWLSVGYLDLIDVIGF